MSIKGKSLFPGHTHKFSDHVALDLGIKISDFIHFFSYFVQWYLEQPVSFTDNRFEKKKKIPKYQMHNYPAPCFIKTWIGLSNVDICILPLLDHFVDYWWSLLLLEIKSFISLNIIRVESQFQKPLNQIRKLFLTNLFLFNHSWYKTLC